MACLFRSNRIALALACAFLPLHPLAAGEDSPGEARDSLALMGSVPIYWGEPRSLGEIMEGSAPTHWARSVIEADYSLVPLDFLTPQALARHDYLLMAQPRALAPSENVALDDWVRAGGRLLLFADPMMTGESRFALGDRRRPMDVALLSPILAHWGLELRYDETQQAGLRMADFRDTPLPVNQPGRLHRLPAGNCASLREDLLLSRCTVGGGRALIVADAAILDLSGPHAGAEAALRSLLEDVFAENGEGAGNAGWSTPHRAENHANLRSPALEHTGAEEPPPPSNP